MVESWIGEHHSEDRWWSGPRDRGQLAKCEVRRGLQTKFAEVLRSTDSQVEEPVRYPRRNREVIGRQEKRHFPS